MTWQILPCDSSEEKMKSKEPVSDSLNSAEDEDITQEDED